MRTTRGARDAREDEHDNANCVSGVGFQNKMIQRLRWRILMLTSLVVAFVENRGFVG